MVEPAPIDAAAFVRFAEAKGVKLDCPACGHDQLLVHAPPGGDRSLALMDVAFPQPHLHDMRASYHVSLQCKNCGLNRLFLRPTVEKWLEENNG